MYGCLSYLKHSALMRLRFSRALQTFRVYPELDVHKLSTNQFSINLTYHLLNNRKPKKTTNY